MAQMANFEVLARFSFCPFAGRWKVCSAETVEWWETPDYSFGTPAIGAPIMKPLKDLAPEREQVTIRVEVPNDSEVPNGSDDWIGLGGLYGLRKSHKLAVFRDDLPDDVIRPHETRKNAPDISGRSFTVLVFENPDLSSLLLPSRMKPGEVEKDAWVMRKEFFDLDESDWDFSLWRFLNSWGLWDYGRGFNLYYLSQTPGLLVVFPHLLLKKRNEYRAGLRQPHKWLSEHSLSFSKIDKPPYFLVEHHYCKDAIEATITVNHLEKRRWGFCKRHDCRKYFEHTSGQKRLYCSPECAHLANVRKLRAEKRKAETKRKGVRRYATRKS
jgi:hypothetical protein